LSNTLMILNTPWFLGQHALSYNMSTIPSFSFEALTALLPLSK
jgi:hypothetical protein